MIAKGTPEKVAATSGSATGEYLQRVLRGESVVPLTDVTFADEAGRGNGASRGGRGSRTNGRSKAAPVALKSPIKMATTRKRARATAAR